MKYQIATVSVLSALLIAFLVFDSQSVRSEKIDVIDPALASEKIADSKTDLESVSAVPDVNPNAAANKNIDFSAMSDNRFKRLVIGTEKLLSDSVYLDNIKLLREKTANILQQGQNLQAQNDIKLKLIGYFSSANGASMLCSNKECLALVKFLDLKAANKQSSSDFCQLFSSGDCFEFSLTEKKTYIFSIQLKDGLYSAVSDFELNAITPLLTTESGKLKSSVRKFSEQQIAKADSVGELEMFVKDLVCENTLCKLTVGNAEYISEFDFQSKRKDQLQGLITLDLSEHCWRTLSGNVYSEFQHYYDVKWLCEY